MRVHNLSEENAKRVKSETGQMHLSRSVTKRKYTKRNCAVCWKPVMRIHNHLKDTHKITDKELYNKLLRESNVYKELYTETETESDSGSEEDVLFEYQTAKRILKDRGITRLGKMVGEVVDSEDSSDDDWLERRVTELAYIKNGMHVIMFSL